MTAFGEVGAVAAGVGRDPLKARLAAAFGEMLAQQRQRNIELGRQLGVQLEARALEVLHLQAILIEHLGQRQAEDIQPAVRIVEAFDRQANVMAGLRKKGEAGSRRRLAGRCCGERRSWARTGQQPERWRQEAERVGACMTSKTWLPIGATWHTTV